MSARGAMAVATMGGLGRLPAPGTFGSLPALPFALLGPLPCLLLGVAVAVLGYVAVREVLLGDEARDPGWIVVDEAAGMLMALSGLGVTPTLAGVVVAFLLFRLLDIAKPWPVSLADRQHGAFGVMLDDIVAGIGAAVGLIALRMVFPGVL